ncbi:MAG: hypothetical protein KC657_21570 [Myxococcales bacterium]|mgnify:CR=1 FL=1|nr:hypothetical protein [Myxococcales bacterium]
MSRAYRVSIRGSVRRVVHVEDGVCGAIELLPIVSRERTSELLAAALEARGFTVDAGRARRDEGEGVSIEVDLATGEVRITAEREQQIEVERERTGSVYEENDVKGRAKLQERLDRDLEREAREAAERSRETLTKALEKRLADVREELDRVSARVAAEALKEKARSLGEIEELREDAETGELTIKVRV